MIIHKVSGPDQIPPAGPFEASDAMADQAGLERYAPLLYERLRGQAEMVDAILADNERNQWRWPSGDYTGDLDFTVDPWDTEDLDTIRKRNIDPSGLGEHERLIGSILSRQLSEATDGPVIALDVGGGKGVTWARLAERYRDEVAAGKILFVVSNLTESGRRETVNRAGSGDDLSSKTLQLLDTAEEDGLVHFVSGPFDELADSVIDSEDGQALPLRGHVTFMHESRSLTAWSKVPELDIPRVTEVLTPDGVYMVWKSDTQTSHDGAPEAEHWARLAGIQIAHRILQERGLTMQTTALLGEQAGQDLCWIVFSNAERPMVVA